LGGRTIPAVAARAFQFCPRPDRPLAGFRQESDNLQRNDPPRYSLYPARHRVDGSPDTPAHPARPPDPNLRDPDRETPGHHQRPYRSSVRDPERTAPEEHLIRTQAYFKQPLKSLCLEKNG